jgi:UDP-N-acetylmuramate--alanine ligase
MTRINAQQVGAILAGMAPTSSVYLVGAGGCGMSGLGHLLLDWGYAVHGSDQVENAFTRSLLERGALISIGHSVEHFRKANASLVIYTPAIRSDNPELLAAQQTQVPIVRRSSALAAIMKRQRGVCVTGMHGKTTTSALLAYALDRMGVEPSYAIGATVPQLPQHARFSVAGRDRTLFIAETDESDGSLPEFEPEHAIILNVDEEHLEYFESLERVCQEFQVFASRVTGKLIFCADDPQLVRLFAGKTYAVSYGFNPSANYRVEMDRGEALHDSAAAGRTRFKIFKRGELMGAFHTRLLGAMNVSNAAAVAALLLELGFEAADIAEGFGDFTGAGRRLEELYHDSDVRVFEDYGHHPEEIEVTLDALKELGSSRLLVAFQPHKYTRTRHLLRQFAKSFHAADKVWISEVYPAGEEEIPGVSGEVLSGAIAETGQQAQFVPNLDQLRRAVREEMRPGDLALFLGAGDITGAARLLADELETDRMEHKKKLMAELEATLSDECLIRMDEPMSKRTTLRVGGPADIYVEPDSEESLASALRFCAQHTLPFRIIGRGSNLLVRDGGFRGVAICLRHPSFAEVRVEGNQLICRAGARLKKVAIEAKQHDLSGLEFFEGIPGCVGGGLRMNAGAMGGCAFNALVSVRFMDYAGDIHERKAEELQAEYRSCPLFKDHVALSAVFQGEPAKREAIQNRMNACSKKRWDSQPAAPSAGCMFKNPEGIAAGKLVDELGLKGMRIGGAMVSDIHGNFVVNDGGARAEDVLELIEYVRAKARQERGIDLHTEVEIMGDDVE